MGLTIARTVAEGLDPRELGNLELWLDDEWPSGFSGLNGRGIADSTVISAWTDLSSKGRDVSQGNSNLQPIFRQPNWNILPADLTTAMVLASFAVTNGSGGALVTPTFPFFRQQVYRFTSTATFCQPFTANAIAVTPGLTYSAFCAMSGVAGQTFQPSLYFYDSSFAQIGLALRGTACVMNAQNGILVPGSVSGVAPPNAVWARVAGWISAGTTGASYDFTGLGLGLGTVPSNYYLPPGNIRGVQFDGQNDFLLSGPQSAGLFPISVYLVAHMFGYNRTNTLQTPIISYNNTSGSWFMQSNAAAFSFACNDGIGTNVSLAYPPTPMVINFAGDGISESSGSVNSAARIANNAGNPWPGLTQPISIGGFSPAQLANCVIQSALIFSKYHDAPTRRRVFNWLAARKAIALVRP